MTEEIKEKIDYEADQRRLLEEQFAFRDGAIFGYSLAEQEIARLKGLIHDAFYLGNAVPINRQDEQFILQQFKSENNL